MAGETTNLGIGVPSQGVAIVPATMADRDRIISFLVTAFYGYEPINVAMGRRNNPSEDDMVHTVQSLSQGRSFLALEGDQLLGVALNGEITVDELAIRKKLLAECTCDDFKKFLTFWVHAERLANFWVEGEPQVGIDLEILAVDGKTRGRGIGKALIERSRQMAKEDGFTLFRMDCSSYYAAKLSETVGMTCVCSIPYKDYKDANGETIFKIPPPHTALNIFKQRL